MSETALRAEAEKVVADLHVAFPDPQQLLWLRLGKADLRDALIAFAERVEKRARLEGRLEGRIEQALFQECKKAEAKRGALEKGEEVAG
jgi:hypothetical protein